MFTDTSSLRLPSPMLTEESSALGRHLQQCRAAQGRLFTAAAWAERAHGMLAPRMITTIGAVAIMIWAGSWWG